MPLGFAKAHHKNLTLKKQSAWPWARGAPQNLEVPLNISTTAEAIDFKFGMQVGFAKAIIKSHPEEKVGVALG